MRNAFIRYVQEYAKNHPELIMLTADMGFSVFEEFRDLYPKQFYNVGIAEATMTGMAAGLALQNYRPIIYSIIPFVTMRNLEQIRVDICYQNLPVIIVGVGGGFSYGALGSTHHAIEDISLMRSLPNMQVLVPSDPIETKACMQYAFDSNHPAYIRLGKNNEPNWHENSILLNEGLLLIDDGEDTALIGVGSIVNEVLKAKAQILKNGYNVAVYSLPVVKPVPIEELKNIAKKYNKMIVIEEHIVNGGAGTAILEAFNERGIKTDGLLYRIGLPDEYPKKYGSQAYLFNHYELSGDNLAKRVLKIIKSL